jgi:hypothetical protein
MSLPTCLVFLYMSPYISFWKRSSFLSYVISILSTLYACSTTYPSLSRRLTTYLILSLSQFLQVHRFSTSTGKPES